MRVTKVLAATNLSRNAQEAVVQAHQWAASCDAELVVCSVLPPSPQEELFLTSRPSLASPFADPPANALSRVVDHVCELTNRSANQMKIIFLRGSAYAEIVRCAKSVGADLLVIGSPGLEEKRTYVLGDTAERVLRNAHCSVLVARPSPRSRRALAAIDGSEQSASAMRAAAGYVKRREGHLTFIHCPGVDPATLELPPFPPSSSTFDLHKIREDAERDLSELVARHDLRGEVVVDVGPAKLLIVKKADQLNAELLVIGATGRTGLSGAQLGDTAAFVVRTAPCSTLVVRDVRAVEKSI